MYCRYCGNIINANHKFCSNCGKPMFVNNAYPQSLKKQPRNYMRAFLKFIGLASLAAFLGSIAFVLTQDDLTSPLQKQLKALKEQKYTEAYYDFTARDFQKNINLERFRKFIQAHPQLNNVKNISFSINEKDDKHAILLGNVLSNNDEILSIEYELLKEDGSWKIQSMKILEQDKIDDILQQSHLNEFRKTIEAHLDALRSEKFQDAYKMHVTKSFRHGISYNEFKTIVNRDPIWKEQIENDIIGHVYDTNTATINLVLISKNQSLPVEYKLQKEKDSWKVCQMQLTNVEDDKPELLAYIASDSKNNKTSKNYVVELGYQTDSTSKQIKMALETDANEDTNETHQEADSKLETSALLHKLIQNQLEAINERNISKAYYYYVSQSFKDNTTLKDFRSFIDNYPELMQVKNLQFISEDIESNKAIVTATAQSANTTINLAYGFTKEKDGNWKILGMSLKLQAKNEDPGMLLPTVEGQLNALNKGKVEEAYNSFVSKGFKVETSLDDFHKFVNQYPELKKNKIEFLDQIIDGNQGFVKVELKNNEHTVYLTYSLIKEDDEWKILGIELSYPEHANSTQEPSQQTQNTVSKDTETQSAIDTIKKQLEAIRERRFEDSYKYASTAFSQATSFDAYKKGLALYKSFLVDIPTIGDHEIKDDQVLIKVLYENAEKPFSVQYSLIKENGSWKIYSMEITPISPAIIPSQNTSSEQKEESKNTLLPIPSKPLSNGNSTPAALANENSNASEQNNSSLSEQQEEKDGFDSTTLQEPIKRQIDLLRAGKIQLSYDDQTSLEFKKATSFEEYNRFIRRYNIFAKNTSLNFIKLNVNNNTPTFTVKLSDPEGQSALVEYDLIKENNEWKILNIQLLSLEESPKQNSKLSKPASLQFANILIGTQVDKDGFVLDPTEILQHSNKPIYINLFIINGRANDKINLVFKHVDSNSTIPTISTTLSKNGETVLTFVFSPPLEGWPTGKYSLEASANGGIAKSFDFRVE